jgi:hypothetical protein
VDPEGALDVVETHEDILEWYWEHVLGGDVAEMEYGDYAAVSTRMFAEGWIRIGLQYIELARVPTKKQLETIKDAFDAAFGRAWLEDTITIDKMEPGTLDTRHRPVGDDVEATYFIIGEEFYLANSWAQVVRNSEVMR